MGLGNHLQTMALSDSESSDTENEVGTRKKHTAKALSNVHRQRSLSGSEVRSETSNYSDSQVSTETASSNNEDPDDDDIGERNGKLLAIPGMTTSDTMHGFAKTTARRPEPRYSSGESGSETSNDHQDVHEHSGNTAAWEGAYSANHIEQASKSENANTNSIPISRPSKVMFPKHKVPDLRAKMPLRPSENENSSPEVSEVGDPDDPDYEESEEVDSEESEGAHYVEPQAIEDAKSEHVDSEESEEAASETFEPGPGGNTVRRTEFVDGGEQFAKKRDLDARGTLNNKKRRRSLSGETSDKASQVPARKRRQLSSTNEPQPAVPPVNITDNEEDFLLPETQLRRHHKQSEPMGPRNQANINASLAGSDQLSLFSDDDSRDDEADNEADLQADNGTSPNANRNARARNKSRSRPKNSEASTSKKTGRFSDKEIRALERFKENWCSEFQIDEYTFNECINHRRKAPFPSGLGFIKKHMLDEFLSALPHRDKRSMFRYKERNWQNITEKPHEWNADQDRELEQLIGRHGTKWTSLASRLGRSQDDVAQRWRNYVAKRATKNTGSWSITEIDKLRAAVTRALQDAGDNSTLDQISWDTVSEFMGGSRTAQQCSGKWHKLMTNDEKSHWYEDNRIVVPEGYRVQLVKVGKAYKKQKPQKLTNPTSVNSKIGAESEQPETYIQQPLEDSEEGDDLIEERSSKKSDVCKHGVPDPKPRQLEPHSSSKESILTRTPRSSTLDSTQMNPTEPDSVPDSARQHVSRPSTPVSKNQDQSTGTGASSSRSSLRRQNVLKKTHLDPRVSKSPPKNHGLRLGDAFSATSPAMRPEHSQSPLLRENRPSPHIAIRKAPARKPGRSDLSQLITDTAEPYDDVSFERVDGKRENLNGRFGGNLESKKNGGLSNEDAQEVTRSIYGVKSPIEQASEDEVDSLSPNSTVKKREASSRSSNRQANATKSDSLAAKKSQKFSMSKEPRLKAKRTRDKNGILFSNSLTIQTTPQDKTNAGSSAPQMKSPPSYEDIMRSECGNWMSVNPSTSGNRENDLTRGSGDNEQEKSIDKVDDASARLLDGKASRGLRKKEKTRVKRL